MPKKEIEGFLANIVLAHDEGAFMSHQSRIQTMRKHGWVLSHWEQIALMEVASGGEVRNFKDFCEAAKEIPAYTGRVSIDPEGLLPSKAEAI